MKHKAKVLTPEEVIKNRSNAYEFIDFENDPEFKFVNPYGNIKSPNKSKLLYKITMRQQVVDIEGRIFNYEVKNKKVYYYYIGSILLSR